ncbi:protealysin inhibitor emfourin [Frigoribacterium sp. 2-23]|uniref:protealysin inhibitor emfourin n=1 Tax=Frigoribacterium sp. 2-23 TaxID=3415006 RepID=UPI003C6F35FE
MIVSVARTGGFAGLTRTWRVDVDTEPDVTAWHRLLDEVPWSQVTAAQPVRPDRFVYVITVDTTPRRQAKLPEQQLTGPWLDLVERVRASGTAA